MLIVGLYTFIICLVAAVLDVAVKKLEPNPLEAATLKLLIIGLAGAAILRPLRSRRRRLGGGKLQRQRSVRSVRFFH